MKKNLILFTFFFIAGFLTHALVFPDFLANGLLTIPNLATPNAQPTSAAENEPLMTKVYFDGQNFSRTNIKIGYTRYIQIINTNKEKLMWLESNHPKLTTSRGYGESEAVQVQFNEKGQFVVADKNNPSERLVITVK